MAFRVRTSTKAKNDLRSIVKWLLKQQAGDSGLRWFQGLRDAVASLKNMPHRCGLAPEDEVFSFEVRHLLYGNGPHRYRVLFTVEAETVTVLHIRHGRRLPLAEKFRT